MIKRGYKLIICVVLVSALFIGFGSAFASAEPVWLLRAKAAVAATMLASQLVLNPVDVLLSEPLASSVDPIGKIEWVETLPEYLDRSTIKVVPDTVVIDGVSYSDIWLGPEAANTLRLQGLDFATAYNILNNQSEAITYATGAGYCEDIPMYNIILNNTPVIQSQSVVVGKHNAEFFNHFDLTLGRLWDGSHTEFFVNGYGSNIYQVTYALDSSTFPLKFALRRDNTNGVLVANSPSNPEWYYWTVGSQNNTIPYTASPFSFDYTSGVIDAPLDPEDGLLLRVPSEYTSQSSPQYNYDIHDLVNIYPTITQPGGHEINIDPDLNPDFEADVDLGNGVGDLIRTILTLLDVLDNIDVEFAPEPSGPEPEPQPGQIDPLPDPDPAPADPVSGTTIADTDWTKLDEILRWIQSTIDSIRHITESLQTMLDSLFDQLQDIIQALHEFPEQLLEDIETGPSKVFRKALDVLKSLFMPLLLPIKAMMNLWHYVVEWVQSISSPFIWIFGVMSGTSYNMVLPIYAVLAGSICIAIYKALGR